MKPFEDNKKNVIEANLARMLSSSFFKSSPRQQRFLEYLVTNTLSGMAHRLKGYTIALEVFDRSSDFDPNIDAIVRVEATRLRNKIRDYYEQQSELHDVVFSLPKGTYQIEFKFQEFSDTSSGLLQNSDVTYINNFPPVITDRPSLAVLPFKNISSTNSNEYFADGITDSLISMLSRLSGLFVISRQSSFTYKNTSKLTKQIATELGVKYLIEGSVQFADQRVRITVNLISAQDDLHIWSDFFDREIDAIFKLQDEITQLIAHNLQVQLSGEEGKMFGHQGTSSFKAYDFLLKGLSCLRQYTQKTSHEALYNLRHSINHDENYAAAHAWLARVLCFQWAMFWVTDKSILDEALEHSQKAIKLEPNSPYAISILGWVYLWKKNSQESISACREAVRLDPNNAEALLFLSLTLSANGEGQEALTYITRAKRITPTSAPLYEHALGQSFYVIGEFEKAIQAFEQGILMSPSFIPTHYLQTLAYAQLGLREKVKSKISTLKSFSGKNFTIPVVEIWTDKHLQKSQHELANRIFSEFGLKV